MVYIVLKGDMVVYILRVYSSIFYILFVSSRQSHANWPGFESNSEDGRCYGKNVTTMVSVVLIRRSSLNEKTHRHKCRSQTGTLYWNCEEDCIVWVLRGMLLGHLWML